MQVCSWAGCNTTQYDCRGPSPPWNQAAARHELPPGCSVRQEEGTSCSGRHAAAAAAAAALCRRHFPARSVSAVLRLLAQLLVRHGPHEVAAIVVSRGAPGLLASKAGALSSGEGGSGRREEGGGGWECRWGVFVGSARGRAERQHARCDESVGACPCTRMAGCRMLVGASPGSSEQQQGGGSTGTRPPEP